MIAPGIYSDLDNEDYHHNPECQALSKGGIDRLLTSPAHYHLQVVGHQNPPTKEMVFGSAFHTRILQPEKFDKEVETKKSVGVPARNEAAENGVSLITKLEMEHINRMSDALFAQSKAAALVSGEDTQFEQSIFWQDSGFDIFCKCRPDITKRQFNVIADLKTTKSAIPSEFSKSCANFNYDVQAAHYLEGAIIAHGQPFNHFLFLAVEKTPPYAVAVYRASDEMIANGAAKIAAAKRIYQRCAQQNDWRAFPDKIQEINLPRWAQFEEV